MADFDEPDSLVQSTFVIPCGAPSLASSSTAKGKGRREEQDGFPILPRYEVDARAGMRRRKAYNEAIASAKEAFERADKQINTATVDSVLRAIDAAQIKPPFYIPGPPSLATVALLGVQLSGGLHRQLRSAVSGQGDKTCWIDLHPRECFTLATTLRIVTARALAHRPDLADALDLSDPASLFALGKDGRICLFIHNLATFHYVVLNDLLQAFHSLSREKDAPAFAVILSAEMGSSTLDDKLDPASLPILEVTHVPVCAPTVGFEKVIEELFIGPKATASSTVWLGEEVLEFLREQYYEQWPSLEDLLATIEVALHHHYSRRPLSVVATELSDGDQELFTKLLLDRIRNAILNDTSDDDANVAQLGFAQLPEPVGRKSNGVSSTLQEKGAHLAKLLQDDAYLLTNLAAFAAAVRQRRAEFAAAVRLVQLVRPLLGVVDAAKEATGDDRFFLEPRRRQRGGLVFALLNVQHARAIIQELKVAMRSQRLSKIELILGQIAETDVLRNTNERQAFGEMVEKMGESAIASAGEDMSDGDGEEDAEARRVARVQRDLLREESSAQLKRDVAEWLGTCLRSLMGHNGPVPLEVDAWTYEQTGYLRAIVRPSPRTNVLAALNDPSAYLCPHGSSSSSATLPANALPDVCRAYQTYQDAGRMINLADWYAAFRLSIDDGRSPATNVNEDGPPQTPKKRVRMNGEEAGQGNGDATPKRQKNAETERETSTEVERATGTTGWNRAEMVQARFALAVQELGRMGFLKRTRRKPEHVMKLVHDLAPIKQ